MSKKIKVCAGKKCKELKSHKQIKLWGKELIEAGKLEEMKKCKCLDSCKKGFAIKHKGKVYSCRTKDELEKVIEKS